MSNIGSNKYLVLSACRKPSLNVKLAMSILLKRADRCHELEEAITEHMGAKTRDMTSTHIDSELWKYIRRKEE